MTGLIWLHEDALRADHPVFKTAGDDVHACFIWDEPYFKEADYSFKRLVFLYETLCELPVEIYQGEITETLLDLADKYQTSTLYVPATPNPLLIDRYQRLGKPIPLRVIADEPFVQLDREPDLKRFSRYWNKAKRSAMQPGSIRSDEMFTGDKKT